MKHIPNILTLCNLACGCVGIVLAFKGSLHLTAYCIGFAALFDFLDGFAARLLKAYSAIGKDLDSLADMVTFGVLPGMIVFQLLNQTVWKDWGIYIPYVGFLIPIFSALRLAKFNNDPRQTDFFYGLPTPANAIFFASFPLILHYVDAFWVLALVEPVFLVSNTIIMSSLMVMDIPLISLKFKDFSWAKNLSKWALIACIILLPWIFSYVAIPLIIIIYLILSFIEFVFNRKSIS